MNTWHFDNSDNALRWHDLHSSGAPLIYLHGLGCTSSSDYPRVVTSPDYSPARSWLVDLPGAGFSDKPSNIGYESLAQASLLQEWIGTQEVTPVALFGHSAGAFIALKLATLMPSSVERLILCAPGLNEYGVSFLQEITAMSQSAFEESGFTQLLIRLREAEGNQAWLGPFHTCSAQAVYQWAASALEDNASDWLQTLASIQIARTAILARGEHPSIDAVRIEMGNTGSKTTIHRYLKELDEADSRRGVPQEQIGDELSELVARLAQRLKEQAQEPIARAEAHYEQLKSELRDQLAEAQQTQLHLQQQLEIQSHALQQETATLESTRSMLQTEQTRNAALNQACSDFELRLNDRDEQIRSLEEKHLHARDALEHYRSAVKEQREQDQRRHEGQLQQMQMELRQAQQSALVRQDEITQLHRDNERLLSESRALAKELNQASDQQHKLSNSNERLSAQVSQLDSERTLLQERLRVATQESQTSKVAQAQAQEANAALTLRALKAEAALDSLKTSQINEPKTEDNI